MQSFIPVKLFFLQPSLKLGVNNMLKGVNSCDFMFHVFNFDEINIANSVKKYIYISLYRDCFQKFVLFTRQDEKFHEKDQNENDVST